MNPRTLKLLFAACLAFLGLTWAFDTLADDAQRLDNEDLASARELIAAVLLRAR